MNEHRVALLWIDHHEARVVYADAGAEEEQFVEAPPRHVLRRHKPVNREHEHPDDQRRFFHDVARALDGSERVVVTGPSTAKAQLKHYLEEHAPRVAAAVVDVASSDHPSDRKLLERAKKYLES